ncbi:MAG: FtsX-like permease family protein [Microthrixaceae bacterium]
MHLGVTVLVVGVLLGVLAALAVGRASRRTPSRPLDRIAARAPSVASAMGLRMAFGRGRRFASTNAVLAGVAVLLSVTVAAGTVDSSLSALLGDRARWGDRADLSFGLGGEELPPEVVPGLVKSPLVRAVTLFGQTAVAVGSDSLKVVGFEPVKGAEVPDVLRGRLPAAAGEIAVSTPAARHFELDIGDALSITGPTGPLDLSVVGVAVVPGVDGAENGEPLVLVNSAGFRQVIPDGGMTLATIYVVDGAPEDAAAQIGEAIGQEDLSVGWSDLPPRVQNFRRVADMPRVITVVVGILALLSLGHVVVAAIRRRRMDLAVLRALGATPGWLRRVVHWQTSLLVVAALAAGTLAGVMIGRAAFRPFPEQIGASPGAAIPWGLLAGTAAGLLVVANLVAWSFASVLARQRRRDNRDLRPE